MPWLIKGRNSLKYFNCSLLVLFLCLFLSLSHAMSIHWFARFCSEVTKCPFPQCFFYTSSWLTKICICCIPRPTGNETCDLQIALPMTLMLPFFCTSGTRYIHAIFELQGRPFCSSLLVSFFWCCYERNSIHTASLSHFISCSLGSPPVLFHPAVYNC